MYIYIFSNYNLNKTFRNNWCYKITSYITTVIQLCACCLYKQGSEHVHATASNKNVINSNDVCTNSIRLAHIEGYGRLKCSRAPPNECLKYKLLF